jgi:hypothetical protein
MKITKFIAAERPWQTKQQATDLTLFVNNGNMATNTTETAIPNSQLPRRRYPYCDVVARRAWSEDPESYAGGRIATGRGSHAGQVKGDDPDKKGYPSRPGWGLGLGLTTPPCKTWICLETSTEGWEGHGPKMGRSATEEKRRASYKHNVKIQ